ncbi:MAG TPA: hypothetical protein VD837_10080 [Terriglobales bacterium]|nr:hypothetical protein [Terriglobales bacterium]
MLRQVATITAMLLLSVGFLCAQTQRDQVPPAAQSGQPVGQQGKGQPVTGKTGNQGTHIDVTTSGSAGQETPGVQTSTGAAQQPGEHNEIKQPSDNASPAEKPGAPPNWQQVGQTPEAAERGAVAAGWAEIGGAGGGRTLGVDNTTASDVTPNAQGGTSSSTGASDKAKPKAKKPRTKTQQSESPSSRQQPR